MAQALLNLSISLPASLIPRKSLSSVSKGASFNRVMAMADEGKDNLNHLQRSTEPQTTQTEKRVAPVAPIGLWDLFPSAKMVQRMMEDPFTYAMGLSPLASNDIGGYRRGRMAWEVMEGEDEYKIRLDMPGMTKKDVKVWIEEKTLVVEAEKMVNENGEDDEWSAKSYGKYSNRIALPENVKVEEIKAEVRDGVLYITLPKCGDCKVLDINVE